eukprot:CAMPEP_0170314714 /NCGR_PEP_ID=MMETSP0116_2-20130129/57941_1 /TAXON_ID=400756 /ORGANISM="Durinskia baltica, Strain CSIRO CS-38" /LENGTH=151 /DNA_ID=CAMNT_0010567185 /DNA_START=1 /DNA_END=454 /DNA_ORIENTATION=-
MADALSATCLVNGEGGGHTWSTTACSSPFWSKDVVAAAHMSHSLSASLIRSSRRVGGLALARQCLRGGPVPDGLQCVDDKAADDEHRKALMALRAMKCRLLQQIEAWTQQRDVRENYTVDVLHERRVGGGAKGPDRFTEHDGDAAPANDRR